MVDTERVQNAASEATGPCVARNAGMFRTLVETFRASVPAERHERFEALSTRLFASIDENCAACKRACADAAAGACAEPCGGTPEADKGDFRRKRFLLRVVVGKASHLFDGRRSKPPLPRATIEGVDRYMRKAFGDIVYDELDAEAASVLRDIDTTTDSAMWAAIRRDPLRRRFVDTVLLRLLFRFERWDVAKKTFCIIVDSTIRDVIQSRYDFDEAKFDAVFEALFAELWLELEKDEQRVRWDFMFGDGASKRIEAILSQGLAGWLERRRTRVLASGRILRVADKK
jgi:hypothetical protein